MGGKIAITLGWWFHDVAHHAEDEADVECAYKVWSDGDPPKLTSRVAYRGSKKYSVQQLVAGEFPGKCPATDAEAKDGISWMANQQTRPNSHFKCVEGCGAFKCNSEATDESTETNGAMNMCCVPM